MSQNEDNVDSLKISLLNYLINYLMKEKKERKEKERYNLTTRVSAQIYQQFDVVCRRLGLTKHGKINVALEGLMSFFVEQYRDHPTIVQQTLTQLFVKAEPRSQVNIDLSQRLELKLVKKDLMLVVNSLEKRGSQDYLLDRLKELLPKALKVYRNTQDPALERLLQKTEKWI